MPAAAAPAAPVPCAAASQSAGARANAQPSARSRACANACRPARLSCTACGGRASAIGLSSVARVPPGQAHALAVALGGRVRGCAPASTRPRLQGTGDRPLSMVNVNWHSGCTIRAARGPVGFRAASAGRSRGAKEGAKDGAGGAPLQAGGAAVRAAAAPGSAADETGVNHGTGRSLPPFTPTRTPRRRALRFDNLVLRALPVEDGPRRTPRPVAGACFSLAEPTPLENPRVVAVSAPALELLGLDPSEVEGHRRGAGRGGACRRPQRRAGAQRHPCVHSAWHKVLSRRWRPRCPPCPAPRPPRAPTSSRPSSRATPYCRAPSRPRTATPATRFAPPPPLFADGAEQRSRSGGRVHPPHTRCPLARQNN